MRIQLSFADPWSIDGPLQDSIGAAKGEHHLLACHDSQRDLGVEWRAGIEDPDIRVCPSPGRGGRFSHWQPARRRRPLKGHRCARPGAGAGARSRRGGEVPREPLVASGDSSCQWAAAATGKARLDLKNRPSTTPLF